MRKNRFNAKAHAAFLGSQGGFESSFTGQMNDVAGRAGIFKKSRKPPGAFGFDGLRTAGLVPLRSGFPLSDELRLKPRDQLCIFTVRSADHAELSGERQRLIPLAV